MDEDQDGGSELGAMFPTPVSKHRFLCNVVVSIVLAGKDTTSSTLTWLFWLLAANPRCELHVHEEARRGGVKGTMHYLHAALTPRRCGCTRRCRSTGGSRRPTSSAVWHSNYSAYGMGRMETLWGADCAEFVPERWLSAGGEFVPVDAAWYPVFHVCPWVCLRKEMAYVHMKAVAAAVIRGIFFKNIQHMLMYLSKHTTVTCIW
jgi:cytochrome P450